MACAKIFVKAVIAFALTSAFALFDSVVYNRFPHEKIFNVRALFTFTHEESLCFFKKILQEQQRLNDAGYVTFYHGQGVAQRMPIELDTYLYGLTRKPLPDNFIFLHTKQHPQEEDALHQQLLNNRDPENSQHLLFLSDSIFGNQRDLKKNSLYYLFENRNDLGYPISLETVLANYGLENYAEKFLPKLERLAQQYTANVSRYGTLYLLAIPRQTVHKSVIPTDCDGCLQPLMVNGEKTTDMQKIADALLSPEYNIQPSDEKEYALAMTHSRYGGSNPDSGLLVFPYIIPSSQKALDDWTKEWEATLDELASAIKADAARSALNGAAASRETQ